ncbi:MAG: hypothetical protein A2062_05015 [Omnitrophica WOR_2 bacterium GWA2_44_7]|nr:MAG: hypothetical protein A2062_05015 [Omnitrophica WOR_2 bacterium GWA2_44_7]
MLEKNNTDKLLEVFFDSPGREFHIRELSRITKISAPTILLAVEALEKRGFLTTHKKGNLKIVKASSTIAFCRSKRVRNMEKLYQSGLIEYLVDEYESPKAIVLFGSFSRGDDIEASDIDIAILTVTHKELDLKFFEKNLARKISIHEVDVKKVSREFYNNLINGIIMEGAIT